MVKQKKERVEFFKRIGVGIISGIILCVWGYAVAIVAALNFLVVLFRGRRSVNLSEFCDYWITELTCLYRYLAFSKDEKPFPFTGLKFKGK